MVIKVIPGQIREYTDIDFQAIQSPLIQRVAGGLERYTINSLLTPMMKLLVQTQAVRRGVASFLWLLIKPHAKRANRCGFFAGMPQYLCSQIHDRGLTICAGHRNDRELTGGRTIKSIGERSQLRP